MTKTLEEMTRVDEEIVRAEEAIMEACMDANVADRYDDIRDQVHQLEQGELKRLGGAYHAASNIIMAQRFDEQVERYD